MGANEDGGAFIHVSAVGVGEERGEGVVMGRAGGNDEFGDVDWSARGGGCRYYAAWDEGESGEPEVGWEGLRMAWWEGETHYGFRLRSGGC